MRFLFFILPLFLLIGCATMEHVGNGLQALRGQKIQTAFNYIGYPDSQQEIAGNKMYIWQDTVSQNVMVPMTTHDTGSIFSYDGLGVPSTYRSTSTSYQSRTNQYSCTIKIITNPADVIIDSQFDGDPAGCGNYARGLERAAAELSLYRPGPGF